MGYQDSPGRGTSGDSAPGLAWECPACAPPRQDQPGDTCFADGGRRKHGFIRYFPDHGCASLKPPIRLSDKVFRGHCQKVLEKPKRHSRQDSPPPLFQRVEKARPPLSSERRLPAATSLTGTHVKNEHSCGPDGLLFPTRTIPFHNYLILFAFHYFRIITPVQSMHFAAPAAHRKAGRRNYPAVSPHRISHSVSRHPACINSGKVARQNLRSRTNSL